MSYHWHLRLPDEARSLPPPPLINFTTVYMAFVGWSSALLHNAVCRRPVLASGIHKQLLFASGGFYVGYYLVRRAAYYHAKRDQDMEEYVRNHPEDFKDEEKKTLAEVLEPFYPIR